MPWDASGMAACGLGGPAWAGLAAGLGLLHAPGADPGTPQQGVLYGVREGVRVPAAGPGRGAIP